MVRLTRSLGKGAVCAAVSPKDGGEASARVAAPVDLRKPRRVPRDRRLSKSFTILPPRVFMGVQNVDLSLPDGQSSARISRSSPVIDEHQALISPIQAPALRRAVH